MFLGVPGSPPPNRDNLNIDLKKSIFIYHPKQSGVRFEFAYLIYQTIAHQSPINDASLKSCLTPIKLRGSLRHSIARPD